jgi:hypothetical protein
MIYTLLLGINQLHLQDIPNSTLALDPIVWESERVRGIFNLTYFALDLIKIGAIIVALSAAYASFRFVKSQVAPTVRSHITYRPRSRNGQRNIEDVDCSHITYQPKSRDGQRTIEDVEVIEMERSERTTTPYY